MGEAADDAFDAAFSEWANFGFRPAERRRRPALVKTCQHCGQGDLRWGNVRGGHWRLKTPEGDLHVCQSNNVERFYGKAD